MSRACFPFDGSNVSEVWTIVSAISQLGLNLSSLPIV